MNETRRESNEDKWRIAWRSNVTGAQGHGTALFNKDTARSIADELNKQDKDIGLVHWAEIAPDA